MGFCRTAHTAPCFGRARLTAVVDLTPTGYGDAAAWDVADGMQVGWAEAPGSGDSHAFLWAGTAGSALDLTPAGFSSSVAYGISGGQQVGTGSLTAGARHALLWTGSAGSVVDLNPAGFADSQANAVCNGQQVGSGYRAGVGDHALLWSGSAASAVDLNPIGAVNSYALGTSGAFQAGFGEFAGGRRALLWSGSAESVVDLHAYMPGWLSSTANDVDAYGNVYGNANSGNGPGGGVIWWRVGALRFSALRIEPSGPFGAILTLDSAKSLEIAGTLAIEDMGRLDLCGSTISVGAGMNIRAGGKLSGHGTVNGEVSGDRLSTISAEGGDLLLGNAASYLGFATDGILKIGTARAVLHSKGFAQLGQLTMMDGGTITAGNGVAIGPGRALAGSGTVAGKVSAGFGSTIEATGALSLGDAAAYDGFYSDGTLLTGGNTVTIHDRNAALLGSLTQLGDGSAGGTLTAGRASPGDTQAHFLLEQGKNMVGRGSVNGNFKNQGDVIGDGVAAGERVIFNSPWIVSGKGTFTNTLIMGTFAPGESPGITNGTNQGFGGPLEIELGGTVPGFGDDKHDQINDTGTILLLGSSTLKILPWNGFVPENGDEFIILTWQAGLDGLFGNVVTDSWFTDRDISFALHYNNIGGAGNLTIEAIPEPATLSLLALLALSLPKRGGLAMIRRRRK